MKTGSPAPGAGGSGDTCNRVKNHCYNWLAGNRFISALTPDTGLFVMPLRPWLKPLLLLFRSHGTVWWMPLSTERTVQKTVREASIVHRQTFPVAALFTVQKQALPWAVYSKQDINKVWLNPECPSWISKKKVGYNKIKIIFQRFILENIHLTCTF